MDYFISQAEVGLRFAFVLVTFFELCTFLTWRWYPRDNTVDLCFARKCMLLVALQSLAPVGCERSLCRALSSVHPFEVLWQAGLALVALGQGQLMH